MKKKNTKYVITIAVLVIVFVGLCYLLLGMDGTQKQVPKSEQKTKTVSQSVIRQTIRQEVTGAGELKPSKIEKLSLNKNYRFKQILVGENEQAKKGEAILEYTNGKKLYAPYDLVVKAWNVPKEKEFCTEQNDIEVQNIEKVSVQMNIPESDINKISIGQEVEVKVSALEDKTYTGKIVKINQAGNYSSTGSNFTVLVEIENDGKIKIGMSATAKIKIGEAKDVLTVPIDAVKQVGEDKIVTVQQKDGTTKDVKVETGLSNPSFVEVRGDLKENDQVLVESKNSNQDMSGISVTMVEGMITN